MTLQGLIVLEVLVHAAFGGVCAMVAANKRHNAVLWFVVGFFLPVIGLIVILCLSPAGSARSSRRYARRTARGANSSRGGAGSSRIQRGARTTRSIRRA